MKTNKLLLIIVAALIVFMLTSFASNDEASSGNRIVREYFDGRTFYVLEDYNGKAVGFIEKR